MTKKVLHFPKVREAREALRAKAVELYEQYDQAIKDALAAQQFVVAIEAMQWLMEHMPADEQGVTMVDISVDKPKMVETKVGPAINIGFALGGIASETKQLEAAVIDVVKEPDE